MFASAMNVTNSPKKSCQSIVKQEHENQECSIKKTELIIENKLSNFTSKIESLEKTTNKQKSSFKFIKQNIANMKSALKCTHESVNQLTLDIDSVNQRTEKIALRWK
ncbi:unnamed protein product [Brachionus calyciflorus]|uniref:Uncharacterized protein n=1 Tax=Brachionus calyciflorus TaxID=104777 RepID=A0A814BIY7_9BILA|nr:unnamed protein product [Brachionus calyciflorus]